MSGVTHLGIRDLQKISAEAISALPGPTPIRSGARTVGLMIPFRKADPERLAATLDRIEALARLRDASEEEAFLEACGADPTIWSKEAVAKLRAGIS